VAILLLAAPEIDGSARDAGMIVNAEAFDWAAILISKGRFMADKKGAWRSHHPTCSHENAFIETNGFAEYAKWHLALDQCHSATSKARYKFPFGDFQNIHRCGLLAIKSRAHQYGYQEIEDAATRLLEMIESAGPAAEKNVDQFR
jgi:hypothetical protein